MPSKSKGSKWEKRSILFNDKDPLHKACGQMAAYDLNLTRDPSVSSLGPYDNDDCDVLLSQIIARANSYYTYVTTEGRRGEKPGGRRCLCFWGTWEGKCDSCGGTGKKDLKKYEHYLGYQPTPDCYWCNGTTVQLYTGRRLENNCPIHRT